MSTLNLGFLQALVLSDTTLGLQIQNLTQLSALTKMKRLTISSVRSRLEMPISTLQYHYGSQSQKLSLGSAPIDPLALACRVS